MKKLQGRVAIVTGATSGMGRATAELFAREGARLILSGRDRSRGREVEETIRDAGGEAHFVAGDVSLEDTNRALVRRATAEFGRLDTLVANAGVLGLGTITELSPQVWRETLATNLDAVYYLLHFGIPALLDARRGSIVVNGSIASKKGFPGHAAYCASKGALPALARQVAMDYGPSIRINVLTTGPVDTPLIWDSAAAFENPAEAVAEAGRKTPLKRLGSPADVAKAALFLASDDSSWITGSSLTIDGGVTSL